MLDILQYILIMYTLAIITEFTLIGGITYLFTKNLTISISTAMISGISMCLKGIITIQLFLN